MKKYTLLSLVILSFLYSFQIKAQDKSNNQRIQELPPGHQLRSAFNGLPPQARVKAENWLSNLGEIPEEDFNALRIDNTGGVYYVDVFPAYSEESETNQNEPIVSEAISLTDVFKLHSNPGATYKVHLDFDGMTMSDRSWNDANNVSTYYARPYDSDNNEGSFSAAERSHIASVWQRVSDDFAPFNIDVTTEEPSSYGPNVGHVLITNNKDQNNRSMPSSNSGGVAYVGIFGGGSNVYYSPALVYYNNSGNEHGNANTASHEFGHNLGLSHHGVTGGSSYYSGHGSGYTSWAPLMGSCYTKNVTQWDNGSYPNANNTNQNDINRLVSELTYRTDDHGNNTSSATPLIIESDGSVNVAHEETDPLDTSATNKGIIEDSTDLDFFSFSTTGGDIALTFTPSWIAYNDDSYKSSNLDIRVKLYNSSGGLIDTYWFNSDIKAELLDTLSAGIYYLSVEGESSSNYSDYASHGKYYISGTIEGGGETNGTTTDFAMLGDFGEDDSQATNVANLVNGWGVDFVTTAGDNRYGSINFHNAVGNKYCQWIANPGISCSGEATTNKFFPAPGNHDYSDGAGINEYLSYFDLPGSGVSSTNTSGNERYYDFIQNDVHFFLIDSDAAIGNSTERNTQQNWLQTQLAASTSNWKVVILHHAPYSSGNHGSNSTMQWPYAAWGADVVMAGHDHHYERIHRDGIVYIVNGLGGRSLYNINTPISGSQIAYNSNYGAVRASVNGDIMNVKFIDISGATIDDYDIEKTVTPPPTDGIVDVQISASWDDVEERTSDGALDENSTDIELGDDPGHNEDQVVGLLFRNISIAQGAIITSAYLEFTVDETDTGVTSVSITANNADNASDFTATVNNVTNRTTTAASVEWDIASWNTIGNTQQSPDITSIVQEIVDRSGWISNNKMAFIINGSGSRTAESYDGAPTSAAKLHIEYDDAPTNNDPIASFTTSVLDRTVTFTDTSTDSDGSIASWSWDFGDTNTSTNQHPIHNYTTDGDFTVTLTVTDNGGATNVITQSVTTCLDTDGDSICDDIDTCNDLIDTDGDGVNDCNDQEINSPCPNNVNANGISIDSDGDGLLDCNDDEINSPCPTYVDANGVSTDADNDGVLDCNDICPGGDDTLDNDGDGIPDFCDSSICVGDTTNFNSSTLSIVGAGSDATTAIIPTDGKDVSFTISGINQRTSGKPANRYIEEVTVTYSDEFGNSQNNGVYTAANGSSVNVSISGIVQSITLSLADGYDGNSSTNLSVNLSAINFCIETVQCNDTDNDGVCDAEDQCQGFDDNDDIDADGIPDGCDSCNDLVDTDSDGVSDCIDQELNSLCPNSVDANGVSLDSDNDGICDELDICVGNDDTIDTDADGVPDGCDTCAGSDDAIDTDNDGTPDGCDTCNDLIDQDNDGVSDCLDQELNSLCPNNVDANGVSIDSDADGVCDDLDNCPNTPNSDQSDTDENGIGDVCDFGECVADSSSLFPNSLTNSGSVPSEETASIPINGQDVSFIISGINQQTSGKRANRYIEEVTVTYVDGAGQIQNYGVFSGTSSVAVSILGSVKTVTVSLTDGYDGNSSTTLSVDFSPVDYCVTGASQPLASNSAKISNKDTAKIDSVNSILVYPNPVTHGKLHVKGLNSETFNYTIVNMLGQTLLKGSSKGGINVSKLPIGTYLIELQNNRTREYKRFIIR